MNPLTRELLYTTAWWPAYFCGPDAALPRQTDIERGRTVSFINGAEAELAHREAFIRAHNEAGVAGG